MVKGVITLVITYNFKNSYYKLQHSNPFISKSRNSDFIINQSMFLK